MVILIKLNLIQEAMNMNFFKLDPEIQAAKLIVGFIHLSGLPYNMFPIGQALFALSYPDKIVFRYSKEKQIELPKEKISNMYLYSYSSEKAKTESSFLKTIAGAALFGAAGAIIGAMPESKIIKKEFTNLVIEYLNHENKTAMIVLDTTKKIKYSQQLIDEFKQEHPEKIGEPVIL